MMHIPLTRGFVALVDDEDYDKVSVHSWHVGGKPTCWYAMRTVYESDGTRWTQCLHVLIMDPPDGMEIDHINHDTLDCRRSNMRFATHRQNVLNRAVPQGVGGSGYSGVSRVGSGRWQARVRDGDGVRHYLGVYDTPEEAARAYDIKAKELHGEFAMLNFP